MMADKGTARENVHADITDTPIQYLRCAMYLPFVDHLLQEMDTRLLCAYYIIYLSLYNFQNKTLCNLKAFFCNV